MIKKSGEYIKKSVSWTDNGLWRIRLADEPWWRAFYLRWLRVFVLSAREFTQDKCSLRASALTFYSVLSLVPLAALAFGVAQGFGVEQMLENLLRDKLAGQEEVVNLVIDFSRNQLVQTRGGLVAGAGILILIWTVLRVLSHIERSFNDIWGIDKERRMLRKFSDYLALVLLGPIVLVAASSLTVYVTRMIVEWTPTFGLLGAVGAPLLWATRLLPGMLIWALFTFMYLFMPNTRVTAASAILGGVVAGFAFQITQTIYVNFQIGVAQYGAIYGSFAALPLFLVWLQLSWVIVLFGAELAYAHQNVDRYEFRRDSESLSPAFRKLLALALVHQCVQAFQSNEAPPSAEALSERLGAPSNAVNSIIEDLVQCQILAEGRTGNKRIPGYLPAAPPSEWTLAGIQRRLDGLGVGEVPMADSSTLEELREALASFDAAAAQSPANRSLDSL